MRNENTRVLDLRWRLINCVVSGNAIIIFIFSSWFPRAKSVKIALELWLSAVAAGELGKYTVSASHPVPFKTRGVRHSGSENLETAGFNLQ